jgi:hypothetical protein
VKGRLLKNTWKSEVLLAVAVDRSFLSEFSDNLRSDYRQRRMYNIILEYILNSKFPNANGVARDRKIMGGGAGGGRMVVCECERGKHHTRDR